MRSPRDVVPLTPTNVQRYRRHLVPLLPLLKALGGRKLLLPEVNWTARIEKDYSHQP